MLIYRRTRNLRAVELLLGHIKLECTVRYLGIEVDDALEIAEQTEVYVCQRWMPPRRYGGRTLAFGDTFDANPDPTLAVERSASLRRSLALV